MTQYCVYAVLDLAKCWTHSWNFSMPPIKAVSENKKKAIVQLLFIGKKFNFQVFKQLTKIQFGVYLG